MRKSIVDFTALMITAAGLGTALRTAESGQWGMFMLGTLAAVVGSVTLATRGVERKLSKPIEE